MTKVTFQTTLERAVYDEIDQVYYPEEFDVTVVAVVVPTGTGSYWCSELQEMRWTDTDKLIFENTLHAAVLSGLREQAVEAYYEEYGR